MAPSPDDLLPLPQLVRELREAAESLGIERAALARLRYRTLYSAVVDGTVRARREGSRWFVRRGDLSQLATDLGLAAAPPAGAARA